MAIRNCPRCLKKERACPRCLRYRDGGEPCGRHPMRRWRLVTLKGKGAYHLASLREVGPGSYYATTLYEGTLACGPVYKEEVDHGD